MVQNDAIDVLFLHTSAFLKIVAVVVKRLEFAISV
jgi:hypothetical protein